MSTAAERERETQGGDVVLSLRDASVSFEMDRGAARVLNGVDLDVRRQEILGVVGESGSGKSMLASAMLDAVEEPGELTGDVTYYPEDGDAVDVLGLSPGELKRLRWEEISMVFQGALSSFNPTMSIRGHFEETLKAHNESVSEGMDRASELLSDLYLDPDRVLDSYPHELSGGMSQRALIALSLVLEPTVLVMDEPTAALDLLMQRSILALLSELQAKYELTVVFITHDLPLVAGLADRLAVVYAFRLAEVGPAAEIVRDAAHPYTRALLKAVPNLDAPLSSMQSIAGAAPDPVNIPVGCSYASRCPMADDDCLSTDPPLYDAGDAHEVACHYWDDADEAVPFDADLTTADASDTGFIDATPVDAGATSADTGVTSADATVAGGRSVDDAVVSLADVKVHFEKEQGFIEGLFSDPDVVGAVDGVSLDIPENDVVALIGESGCGKTTLGKTAIGVQRPTDGSVSFRGQDVWEAKAGRGDVPYGDIRRSLQIIHQDPGGALNPNRTVMKTLTAPLKRWHDDMSSEDRRARVLRMIERVGMEPATDYAHRYPHQLSGGEQQRVALVRALLMNPDLILADEAVSALDVSLRVEMMELMLELQEQFDTSFLFISHNLSNARYLAEKSGGRVGIMYLGELVEIGPAETVLQNPKHPYTKVLRWATADLDPSGEVAEPPVRDIDIPDPVDPPSGCRFHTRCPAVIPPDDVDIGREAYNEVLNLRQAIDGRSIDLEGRVAESGSAASLRSELFDRDLPHPDRSRVDDALESLLAGEWETASATLRERYESICERSHPELTDAGHPVACHRFEQPSGVETVDVPPSDRQAIDGPSSSGRADGD